MLTHISETCIRTDLHQNTQTITSNQMHCVVSPEKPGGMISIIRTLPAEVILQDAKILQNN